MPTGVYTERLLYGEGDNATDSLTVPEGERLVLSFICVSSDFTSAVKLWLNVHGVWPLSLSLPVAATQGYATDLRLVAYQRETVQILTNGVNIHFMLTGYRFPDSIGAPSWPAGPTFARPPIASTPKDAELWQDGLF